MSSSISVPASKDFGQRKKTPEELISRVTSVMGYSSRTPQTLLSCRGSFKLARGLSRCSVWTPTAWVGTCRNRRGCGVLSSGLTHSAGTGCGPGLWEKRGARSGCSTCSGERGKFSQAKARFLALISPLSGDGSTPGKPVLVLLNRETREGC